MIQAFGELILTATKAIVEWGMADKARRAKLRAEMAAAYASVEAFWTDFEARADDRIEDALSDARGLPSRDEPTKP